MMIRWWEHTQKGVTDGQKDRRTDGKYHSQSCLVAAKNRKYNNMNKANLRDLIAATGLIILLKWDSYCQFFSPCDLEIWWITPKNNRAPLLYHIKFCASFHSHQWIRAVTAQFGSKWAIFCPNWPWNLSNWRMTSKNDRAPILCCFKLCASFQSHGWIQTGITVRKCPI